MATFLISDRNGATVSMDTTAVGANQAPTQVMADQNGVKFSLAPGAVALPVQAEGVKSTYQYAILGFAPVATPTDIVEIKGSATKTVRVRRITVGGVATAAGNMPIQLFRRSTASTGGGSVLTALTPFKTDTSYDGATATVSSIGTANPTLGTAAGGIGAAGRVQMSAVATGVAANLGNYIFDFLR